MALELDSTVLEGSELYGIKEIRPLLVRLLSGICSFIGSFYFLIVSIIRASLI